MKTSEAGAKVSSLYGLRCARRLIAAASFNSTTSLQSDSCHLLCVAEAAMPRGASHGP